MVFLILQIFFWKSVKFIGNCHWDKNVIKIDKFCWVLIITNESNRNSIIVVLCVFLLFYLILFSYFDTTWPVVHICTEFIEKIIVDDNQCSMEEEEEKKWHKTKWRLGERKIHTNWLPSDKANDRDSEREISAKGFI